MNQKKERPPRSGTPSSEVGLERRSKKAIITEYLRMQEIAQRYLQVSIVVAVELYRRDPKATPFRDGTFVPDSIRRIAATCHQHYKVNLLNSWRRRLAAWWIRKLVPVRKRKPAGGAASETVS